MNLSFLYSLKWGIRQFVFDIKINEHSFAEVELMNIRMHYPETEEGLKELNQRMAKVQADTIINYINNLNCSYEEKKQILKKIGAKDKD